MNLVHDINEEFNRFWKACPRKTGKAAARKAFPRALKKGITTDQLIEDMSRRVEQGQWSLSEKRFIPHPATYLNGERWEDEIIGKSNARANTWGGTSTRHTSLADDLNDTSWAQ
jgi:hypothetical protein